MRAGSLFCWVGARLLAIGLVVAVASAATGCSTDRIENGTEESVALALKTSVERGDGLELRLTMTPPDGVMLNRYPGITLDLEQTGDLQLDAGSYFVGSREPITDLSQAYFDEDPEIVISAQNRGEAQQELRGELSFFYCLKESGVCAPATQSVRLSVLLDPSTPHANPGS